MWALVQVPAVSPWIQLPASGLGKTADELDTWVSDIHGGDRKEAPGSWHQSDSALAIVHIWGIKQAERKSFCLSLILTFKYTNKSSRKMRCAALRTHVA